MPAGNSGIATMMPWPPSMFPLIRASAARMNGTARVSSAKISPRRDRSRKAIAPIASASTAQSPAPTRIVR